MKFRITKQSAEFLLKQFDKKDTPFAEIELEPVYETCREAEMFRGFYEKWYRQGYDYGYREGYYEGSKIKDIYPKSYFIYPPLF